MAKSLRNIPLPPIPSGPIKGEDLRSILWAWQLEVLAYLDIRNDATDFAPGLVATPTGVTLGAQALPSGRTVGVPALFTYIGDTGQAASQRLLNQVSAGNKQSTQTSQPLSAADVGSTVTITVAAHNVQFGFGAVSYGSGSVTGLGFSTEYYVYADDPTFAGGAVTYYATTNPNNVTANSGRYYVGKVSTPADGAASTSGTWGGGGGGSGYAIP